MTSSISSAKSGINGTGRYVSVAIRHGESSVLDLLDKIERGDPVSL
jgi:hypothetical protein